MSLSKELLHINDLLQKEISSLLPKEKSRLIDAMHYSGLSTGKRLRPFILITTADIFNVPRNISLRVAAVIELIHSYSLIHDDLPAMDDDDYRRGIPSCHKKFDEATAILAGDSLLTIAFEILADEKTHSDAAIRCQLITILAQNIGANGMAGGQMYDLIYERETLANYQEILDMHWMKTARLFIASCMMGATLGRADSTISKHLYRYSEFFGLAFQFIDDLEDDLNKLTNNNIVKIIGYDQTKIKAKEMIYEARKSIGLIGTKGKKLDLLAAQLLNNI